jgi:hypothetical protein
MRYLKIIALLFFIASSAYASSLDSFHWLNSNNNSQLFQEIEKAFSDELKPDIPEKVDPYVPMFYKYIAKIGSFRNSDIILIGYRAHKNDEPIYDFFRAFSYDVIKRTKREIEPKGYFRWSFVKLARFEHSATPDVVFQSFDCIECEATELLASFRFDEKNNLWEKRKWPNNDTDLMVGSDTQFGEDDYWSYDCLYKIADFNHDNFDDIVIRCREKGEITHKVKDELLFYTVQKGKAKKIQIREKKIFKQISNTLCLGQNSPLCTMK